MIRLLLLLALLVPGCTRPPEAKKAAPTPIVGAARPRVKALGQEREYTGTVESLNQVAIVPQLAGQLESVTVSVGDRVRRGQLLGHVDDSQIQAQVAQAQASYAAASSGVQTATANLAAARDQVLVAEQAVASAEANVIQNEAGVAKAETQVKLNLATLERIQAVAKKDLVSHQVVDETAAQAEMSRADLRSAQALLKSGQGQLQQAKLRAVTSRDQEKAARAQLTTAQAQAKSQASALAAMKVRQKQTSLTSPIEGVVVARPLDPGAYVSPSNASPILIVASLQNLRVSFQLSEADLPLVKARQDLEVRYDALPRVTDSGVVQRLAGGLNPSTRTMRVELRLQHPDPALRPGMLARLRLHGESHPVLTIPMEGVISDGSRQFAWLVDSGGIAHRQSIQVQEVRGNEALIKGGLGEKDLVVVRGVDQVQEGKEVKTEELKP